MFGDEPFLLNGDLSLSPSHKRKITLDIRKDEVTTKSAKLHRINNISDVVRKYTSLSIEELLLFLLERDTERLRAFILELNVNLNKHADGDELKRIFMLPADGLITADLAAETMDVTRMSLAQLTYLVRRYLHLFERSILRLLWPAFEKIDALSATVTKR